MSNKSHRANEAWRTLNAFQWHRDRCGVCRGDDVRCPEGFALDVAATAAAEDARSASVARLCSDPSGLVWLELLESETAEPFRRKVVPGARVGGDLEHRIAQRAAGDLLDYLGYTRTGGWRMVPLGADTTIATPVAERDWHTVALGADTTAAPHAERP